MTVSFKILLWKNFKSERRMLLNAAGEVLAILLLGVLIIANSSERDFSLSEKERSSFKIFPGETLYDLNILRRTYEFGDFPNNLAYEPKSQFAKDIAEEVAIKLDLKATTKYIPNKFLAKLIFANYNGQEKPENLTVHIRFPGEFRTYKSTRMQSNLWLSRCSGCLTSSMQEDMRDLQTDLYIREGFLQLQHAVFVQWFSKLEGAGPSDFAVDVRSFKYDIKERLCQSNQSPNILSLLYYCMFCLPFLNLIWKYGRETEENLLAHHWRYGCSSSMYWGSHFLCSFVHFLVLDVIVFILIIISWVLRPEPEYSTSLSYLYIFLILLLTACELIISAMVIATLIPCAVSAIYFGIFLWVILYAAFAIILEYAVNVKSYWVASCLVIMFNNDFVYGTKYLTNLDESTAKNIVFLFAIIISSIFLKLIYLIGAQYFKPGRYVQRGPFHYFGLRSLCGRLRESDECPRVRPKPALHEKVSSREDHQFGPLQSERSAVVSQVSKSFKNFREPVKFALKQVNMIIFRGEITVVLGHFSSGKTTYAAMLAGWQKPTQGVIEFFDKNIRCDKNAITMADVSMPNNALFDYLTAFETLEYFVNVKGKFLQPEPFNEEIQIWLKSISVLFKHGDVYKLQVKYMTFAQKRLLALCCALCCGTKIVILDEPTAHLMVDDQRLYWSILQREKAERSIVVMTNSFREAEVIGDRIAIFTDGLLKAYGTAMFLKSMFGLGFNLIIIKAKNSPSEPITEFLQQYVPEIIIDFENQAQLIYIIPSDNRPVFQKLLIELEKRREEFGIAETRILTTDLSEVFLSLGKIRDIPKIPETAQALSVDFLSKRKRIRQQWAAMFFNKFKHQPSTVIPLTMCLLTILLVTLSAQTLNILQVKENAANSMVLGFDDNHDRRILGSLEDCKIIGIKKVRIGNMLIRDKSHSFTFLPDSFFCSDLNFMEHMSDSHKKMYHMYGVLEINGDSKYTLYVNQHILHSAPLVLNLLHNFILQRAFQFRYDMVARVVNDPLPIPAPHATGLLNSQLEHLFLPLAIGIVLPVTLCTFILAAVEERRNSALMLMSIAGLRIDIYWFVNFIWDWLTFFAYSLFFQIVIIISYYYEIRLSDTFLIFLIVNVYSLPLLVSLYFQSMVNQNPKYRAFVIACVIHIISGLFAFVVYWSVFLAQPLYLYLFLLFPTFAMLEGISNVFVMSRYLNKCTQLCKTLEDCNSENICSLISECCEYSFFDWGNSGIVRSIFFLFITTILTILLIFWVEIHQRESKFLVTSKIKKMFTKTYSFDDPNITEMRERIASEDLQTIAKKRLVVDQVERKIPRDSMALKTISFDVGKSFCLGIYGTNHVGKSHLCRQIVGQDGFRFGDIYVRGVPVKYNINDSWAYLGYAPQGLSVLTGFTVNEILHFFCLIRGVPKGAIPTVASDISTLFSLEAVKNRKIGVLSKGSQRKVTIAVAFVATNKIIVLDEPTRGLPQWTCREIWKALRYMCVCGKSIVFTTRSMHECDAIADAVLVIDDKDMLAYGSTQHLRSKQIGFYLEIRLRRDGSTAEEVEENLRVDVDNLHRFMIFMHGDSILINRIDNTLKFYLPVEKVNFNVLFGSLERNRVRLNISEYTVSQGNFEEVLKLMTAKREQKLN